MAPVQGVVAPACAGVVGGACGDSGAAVDPGGEGPPEGAHDAVVAAPGVSGGHPEVSADTVPGHVANAAGVGLGGVSVAELVAAAVVAAVVAAAEEVVVGEGGHYGGSALGY